MAFKKSYSTLSKAAIQMKADNITIDLGKVSDIDYFFQLNYLYVPKAWGYFKTIGDIPFDDEKDYDEENDEYLNGYKEFGSETILGNFGESNGKILSDGSSLMLEMIGGSSYPNAFLHALVDTNGYKKGPNRMGYDVFAFEILSTGQVVPSRWTCHNIDVSTTITNVTKLRKGVCFAHYALADKSPTDTSKSYFKDFLK